MSQTTFFLTTGRCKSVNRIPVSKEQSVSGRAPVDFIRGFRNPEIFLVESGILGFEILNTAQGIQNPAMIRIQNPSSFVKDPESTAMNPESKTVWDYLI